MTPQTLYTLDDLHSKLKQKFIDENKSKGEAVVQNIMVDNIPHIAVGIVGTKKSIALCGVVDAPDNDESVANAFILADAWNKIYNKP